MTTQGARPTVLVLYTELAPYVLAGLNAFVEQADVDLHLVRWPVNKEAPFDLHFHPRITVHERSALSDEELLALALRLMPHMVLASGWVDKGYLKACRAMRKRGAVTVMSFDTAWRGDARQWANMLLAPTWMSRTYSHAWVTGDAQAIYAHRLGLGADRVRTGFYSADTPLFVPLGERLLRERSNAWPHRFLCVARYIPTKGHQLLCDAFAELCDAGDAGDWELWLAGTGELHQQVMASYSGNHPRIKHLGFKQVAEVNDVVAQSGVFVLPSTYEPWGVVVHEHACAGLPLLLSSAVGAADRFLVEGENGHRFIAGDKETLKNMLRMFILSSDAELNAMGRRSAELGRAWSPAEWARTANELLHARP